MNSQCLVGKLHMCTQCVPRPPLLKGPGDEENPILSTFVVQQKATFRNAISYSQLPRDQNSPPYRPYVEQGI